MFINREIERQILFQLKKFPKIHYLSDQHAVVSYLPNKG